MTYFIDPLGEIAVWTAAVDYGATVERQFLVEGHEESSHWSLGFIDDCSTNWATCRPN